MAESEVITTQDSTLEQWTSALGEAAGSPGGGAGAGVMLAIAASLTSMVARYTEPDPHEQGELDALIARTSTLRRVALQLADDDSAASQEFGSAFRMNRGEVRDKAIRDASVGAARASAELGDHACDAIDDLVWVAHNGNRALIADVVVAFGALRAALTGARTNVSFDLAALTSSGLDLNEVREQHPHLWKTISRLDAAIERIDSCTADVDDRAAPTDSH